MIRIRFFILPINFLFAIELLSQNCNCFQLPTQAYGWESIDVFKEASEKIRKDSNYAGLFFTSYNGMTRARIMVYVKIDSSGVSTVSKFVNGVEKKITTSDSTGFYLKTLIQSTSLNGFFECHCEFGSLHETQTISIVVRKGVKIFEITCFDSYLKSVLKNNSFKYGGLIRLYELYMED